MSANGISHETLKRTRQDRKLEIAAAKRQGKVVATDGTITGSVDSSKPYYRSLNVMDVAELPTRYHRSDNTGALEHNTNALLDGRPWSADGQTMPGLILSYDPEITTSGATIYDQSGNGVNSTMTNVTHDTSSTPNEFDFSNGYIMTPDLYNNVGTNDSFSVGVWTKPTLGGVVLSILGQSTIDTGYHFAAISFLNYSGRPTANIGLWNSGIHSVQSSPLYYNNWYHVVLTYNTSTSTLTGYINGASIGSTSVNYGSPRDYASGSMHFAFGATDSTHAGNGNYYNGSMGEIRVYDDELSSAEVLTNYNTTKARYGL